MGRLILITGGARSGKSSFAEKLAAEMALARDVAFSEDFAHEHAGPVRKSSCVDRVCSTSREGRVTYIATCIPGDDEMLERVKNHKRRRPSHWNTVEEPLGLTGVLKKEGTCSQVVLVDCLGLYVTNLLLRQNEDMPINDRCQDVLGPVREFARVARTIPANVIVVSNETGMGLVPTYQLGRLFRDTLGLANQILAEASDEVYFMVSGIPVEVKLKAANQN
jgi:adenosylcobinamide kinase/adenosylcobinamide-phosphate guanylyltransferase